MNILTQNHDHILYMYSFYGHQKFQSVLLRSYVCLCKSVSMNVSLFECVKFYIVFMLFAIHYTYLYYTYTQFYTFIPKCVYTYYIYMHLLLF